MNITGIISAIGNNSSVYPLLIRDCGIENPTKVAMTYNQNKRDKNVRMLATRERFFDEYLTSAVWLGSIPLIEKINKAIIKRKGFNPDIDVQLLKEVNEQGLEYNIKKFKDKIPEIIKEMEFVKNNKPKFMRLIGGKVFTESIIPMLLMGFVIPKVLFAWTANTKKRLEKTQGANFKKSSKLQNPSFAKNSKDTKQEVTNIGSSKNAMPYMIQFETMEDFTSKVNNKNKKKEDEKAKTMSFKGLITKMANFTPQQKMYVTDGGYSIGRVLTARNGYAALDIGCKMLGMLYLNFVFPTTLANFLNKNMGKLTNTNLNLDIKLLDDKNFIDALKNKTFELPKAQTGNELLQYIDQNPNSLFAKLAAKDKKIIFLKNGIRDPRRYVDLNKLKELRNNIASTAEKALKSKDIANFMKKTKNVKAANIIANICISSLLLAWGLPSAQFAIRELITKCELEPGILDE